MDVQPIKQSIVFLKKSCRMIFWQLWMETYETVENMSCALDTGQRPEDEVRGIFWMHWICKKLSMESGGGVH